MIIKSINKTTLLDYPGKVAATIFLAGCNMNCSFCHNKDLIRMDESNSISKIELFEFLEKRKNELDGVCITGGEPTLNSDLLSLIKDIKNLGYLVKLDTNGTNPDMVSYLINEKLVDYIAMDIKTSFEHYKEITNSNNNVQDIIKSVDIIRNSNVDHEFRTTVISDIKLDDLVSIAKYISPSKYYLQEFKDFPGNNGVTGISLEVLEHYRDACSLYTETNLRKK